MAPFERSQERQGQHNGYCQRDLNTVVGLIPDLQVPRDRAGEFQTQVFERNEAAISEAIAQMWVGGVSQSKVAAVTEPLMGIAPSATRITHDLEGECEAWRSFRLGFFDLRLSFMPLLPGYLLLLQPGCYHLY